MVTVTARAQSIFDALGDPTRRDILALLRGGPRAVGEIADRLPVSRPAVSKHLRVLANAGLVAHDARGTRHLFRLDETGFTAARDYLDDLWTAALRNFERYLAARSRRA